MEPDANDFRFRTTRSKKVFSPFVITPEPGKPIRGPWDFDIMTALAKENENRMAKEDSGDGYESEADVELEDLDYDSSHWACPSDSPLASTSRSASSASPLASTSRSALSDSPFASSSYSASSVSSSVMNTSPPSSPSPLGVSSASPLPSKSSRQRASSKAMKRRRYKPHQREKRDAKREADSSVDPTDLRQQLGVRLKRAALKKATKAKRFCAPDLNAAQLPASSAGWTGRRQEFVKEHNSLAEAFDLGLHLLDWRDDETYAIVDKNSVMIAVLGAPPPGQSGTPWSQVVRDANQAVETARTKISFTDKERNHRRGDFPAVASGISFGGGQKRPGILKHSKKTNAALHTLLSSTAFQRISGYANSLFATFAPRVYQYYVDGLVSLQQWNSRLTTNFSRTAFAACTWNFGPVAVSYPHTDSGNVAFGWCAITALGDYDPDTGGHLILWDLGLVIRFPPGATILIPSALLVHSNVQIQEGETRYAFVQYSAGGLFRWIHNGYQTEEKWRKGATPAMQQQFEQDRRERAQRGLERFSKYSELLERYERLGGR